MSSRWKPGVNYDVIAPAQPTNAPPGKVQVMEVFWLACPRCYALEPYMRAWRKSKPDYVQFVRVPVMWGPVQQAQARLFYTLKALDRDDLVDTAFKAIHDLETQTGTESLMIGSSRASTMRMQEAFAVRNGLSAAAFKSAYNSFDVRAELQHAEQITQLYEIRSVPTTIVDGRYSTDPAKAGGDKQMIALIDFLAKWVHDHRSAP
jgi:thiol:disulfide interchange protein DsbA